MRHAFPSAFRRPGVRFLSHPVPATHISAPYGHAHRPSRRVTGFPCSTHSRYDLAGCRLSPEGGGVLAPSPLPLSRHLPDLPRLALATPDICQLRGSTLTRSQRRFTRVHPSRPSPCPLVGGRLTTSFGFPRGLRTPSSPTKHATAGTGLWTLARTTCSSRGGATSNPCNH